MTLPARPATGPHSGRCWALPPAPPLLTLTYATIRYAVFGPWNAGHIPLYTLNKSISWSALWPVALALDPVARLAPRRFGRHLWRRRCFRIMGLLRASLGVVISRAILNCGYYRQVLRQAFDLTALVESSMAMGALTLFVLLAPLAGLAARRA